MDLDEEFLNRLFQLHIEQSLFDRINFQVERNSYEPIIMEFKISTCILKPVMAIPTYYNQVLGMVTF